MQIDTSINPLEKNPDEEEMIRLVGFRVNPDVEGVEFYSIFLEANVDRPLIIDERFAFFTEINAAKNIIKNSNLCEKTDLFEAKGEIDYCCDIAETLYLIASQRVDQQAVILNCINTILDLEKWLKIKAPEEFKQGLRLFADYLTFHQELESFFESEKITRREITNAIIWYVGAIFICSTIITSLEA